MRIVSERTGRVERTEREFERSKIKVGVAFRFWSITGEPPEKQWLYLGDYVDRCTKGLEVWDLIFGL